MSVITESVTHGVELNNVEMKKCAGEWPGMIPAHWEVKRLK